MSTWWEGSEIVAPGCSCTFNDIGTDSHAVFWNYSDVKRRVTVRIEDVADINADSDEVKRLKEELAALKQKHEDLGKKCDWFVENAVFWEGQYREAKCERNKTNVLLQETQSELAALKRTHEVLGKNRDWFVERVNFLEKESKADFRKITGLKDDLAKVAEERDALKQALDSIKSRLANLIQNDPYCND